MNNRFFLAIITLLSCTLQSCAQNNENKSLAAQLEKYNVKWHSQSQNSSESMPLGGGDIGLNVWVENGDILFYMSKSDAFDENNQFLKLGRTRLQLEPNIFADNNCQFSQELKLEEGYIQIKGKTNKDEVVINLWVDVMKPVIHMDVHSNKKINVEAHYEYWRYFDRELPLNERHAAYSYSEYPGKITTFKDSVRYAKNSVLWFHRNKPDQLLFDFAVEQQGLENVKDQLINTQKNVTFGGLLLGENMIVGAKDSGIYVDTPFKSMSIKSQKKDVDHKIAILLLNEQVENIDVWEKQIFEQSTKVFKNKDWDKTKLWWKNFWNRSFISINNKTKNPNDKAWQVGRNYQLFRYMLACNAYGNYPTKFNGGLLTTDPQFVPIGSGKFKGTPDFRAWGGGSFTAQNQRLVYWPMLKSGDFDMMPSQFDFYARSLKNVELRTEEYWGHKGASFTEHPETFGLPAASTWGFESGKRKRSEDLEHGTLANQWVRLHYTNQLEFSFMILKYYQYSKMDISKYIPFIESSLTFFFEHYKYRQIKLTGKPYDEFGKLVIYPSTACETYKNVKNPTDISAALKSVIREIQMVSNDVISQDKKTYWLEAAKHIPELTYDVKEGKKILVSANDLPERINTDMPEMYPVFPYEIYGVGLPNIEIPINTWNSGNLDDRKNYVSWHQDAIFCARMRLTDEAKNITIKKLQDSKRRFPTFWGPGHDYVPDHNWGGSGMIGLQDMLLQSNNGKIYLFPSWPKDWDVDFKLNAPNNTIIQGSYKNGKIENMEVFPNNRLKDVIIKKGV